MNPTMRRSCFLDWSSLTPSHLKANRLFILELSFPMLRQAYSHRIRTEQLARDHDGMMYLNYYRDCLSATILSKGKPNPNWFPGLCKLVERIWQN